MWFKKKKKVESKPDFSQYKIKINGKVMCTYEAMTGKSFLKIETEEDIFKLFYCSLVISNPEFSTLTYDVFLFLIQDEDVTKWLVEEYQKISAFLSQFKERSEDEEGEAGKKETKVFFMTEAISGLIVRMGLDPHYVMFEMDEWEISKYYEMMQQMDRDRLSEERLWTYLQVLPHVGKKLGGPEKLLPFPWEKDEREAKANKGLKAASAFFSKKMKDEGRLDDSIGQGGVSEATEDA